MNENKVDVLLVSFVSHPNDDNPVMIIGKKEKGELIKIINAFQGEEALDLYKKLTVKKEN